MRKRLCLYAGFSNTCAIEEYVIHAVKEVSSYADVYYFAANDLPEAELRKLVKYTKGQWGHQHDRYDFGSWQKLMFILGWRHIERYDALMLLNDSNYGPLFSLDKLFQAMAPSGHDMWGVTMNYGAHAHVQSYFLHIDKKVFQAPFFRDFFETIAPQPNKKRVSTNYEVGLSRLVYAHGFSVGSYIDKGTLGISFGVDVTAYQNTLLRAGSPFIKRKVFFEQGFAQEDQAETLKLLCELGYPLEFFHVQKTAVKDCRANNVGASCTVGASKQVLRTMLERVVKNIILFFYGPIKSRIVNKIDKIHEQTHRLHAELMRLHKRLDSFTYASPTSEQHKQPATAHTGLEAANETLSQDYDEKYFIWHEECPLCQRQIIKVEHFSFPEPMYYLYRCLDCGMIFLNPWNTRSETYPDDFFLHLRQTLINTGVINEDNSINFLTAEAWYECALALTRKHHIGCDIIDIGAGYGMLTALLQHRNFPTVALERSEVLTSIARDIFKTNVLCCDIDTYNGKKFGFGVLNAVIEHVHNPIAFLKNIRTNLFTADAKLVVTSLNILSTQSVFEIENSFCFSSGHVWYFSEATLCMLMERAGFKLIELYRPNLPLSEPHKNLATYLVDFCGLDINYYGATAGIWSAAE